MGWYWWLCPLAIGVMYKVARAKDPRDGNRWASIQHALVAVFAAGSFLDIWDSNDSPVRYLGLMMLMLALFAGAMAVVYFARWRNTPTGPPIMMCPACDEVVKTPEEGYHHIRLMHPDWHEQLTDEAARRGEW